MLVEALSNAYVARSTAGIVDRLSLFVHSCPWLGSLARCQGRSVTDKILWRDFNRAESLPFRTPTPPWPPWSVLLLNSFKVETLAEPGCISELKTSLHPFSAHQHYQHPPRSTRRRASPRDHSRGRHLGGLCYRDVEG